jgi:HEAT repeat protein
VRNFRSKSGCRQLEYVKVLFRWTHFLFASVLFANTALAEVTLSGGVVVSAAQINQITQALARTPNEIVFYHWTKPPVGVRWLLQGGLNQSEVDFYNRPTGDRQVHGPGVYLAKSPTSSEGFGSFPIQFISPKGTLLYDPDSVSQILGVSLDDQQASELGKVIPFLRNVKDDWYVANNSQALGTTRYVRPSSENKFSPDTRILDQAKLSPLRNLLRDALPHNWERFNRLENLIALSFYMDASSFVRGALLNPDHPEQHFEPENFPRFRQTLDTLLDEPEKLTKTPIRNAEVFGAPQSSAEDWARGVIQDFQVLHNSLSGRPYQYRNEGIRAGGTLGGNRMLVTPAQYLTLKKNLYLEINGISDPEGRGILVEYFYPDVFHLEKIKERLSPELFKEINSYSADTLMADSPTRRRLNEKLVQELLLDGVRKLHGQLFQPELLQKLLVSIHPSSDMNGRTSRLFSFVRPQEGLEPLRFPLESDNDLLMSKRILSGQLDADAHNRQLWLDSLLMGEIRDTARGKSLPSGHGLRNHMIFSHLRLGEVDGSGWAVSDDDLGHIYQRNLIGVNLREVEPFPFGDHPIDEVTQVARDFNLQHLLPEMVQSDFVQMRNAVRSYTDPSTIPYSVYIDRAKKLAAIVPESDAYRKFNHQLSSALSSFVDRSIDEDKGDLPKLLSVLNQLNPTATEQAIRRIAKGISAESWSVRQATIKKLGSISGAVELPVDVVSSIINRIPDSDSDVRTAAYVALVEMSNRSKIPPIFIPDIARFIGTDQDSLARQLLVNQAKAGHVDDSLIAKFENKLGKCREGRCALAAIVEIQKARNQNPHSEAVLAHAARDYFDDSLATATLDRQLTTGKLSDGTVTLIASHLSALDWSRRRRALQMLGEVSRHQPLSDQTIKEIIQRIPDSDSDVRTAAYVALVEMSNRSKIPPIFIPDIARFIGTDQDSLARQLLVNQAKAGHVDNSLIAKFENKLGKCREGRCALAAIVEIQKVRNQNPHSEAVLAHAAQDYFDDPLAKATLDSQLTSGKLSDDTVTLIASHLSALDWSRRRRALQMLGEVSRHQPLSEEMITAIAGRTKDTDSDVRGAAEAALHTHRTSCASRLAQLANSDSN